MLNKTGPGPRGMALVAVLWIVAALSIMVLGLTATVKQYIHTVTLQRDLAQGQALGEAAIALALQQLAVQTTPITSTGQTDISYAGVDIPVTASPLDGWIALNSASAPMLTALLQTAGGLDQTQAQQMAAAIIEWRDGVPQVDITSAPTSANNQTRGFEAVDDLMLVPGMNYDLYTRIAPLVTTSTTGAGVVNAQAAPPGVAAALGTNTALITPAGSSGSNVLRLIAAVPLATGKILRVTEDVALLGIVPDSATPWRILREEAQIAVASSSAPG